ncbi:precorrin-6y C5,15-methyltransferase (decarboxylating) subunit CbiE, partial [Dietzia sp.]|uniref:precorrin-6y C5,15-methyltransferase (decarboxylating) subunit CbiE n=1 Tax=Dietzia sp. TaxID=1871616 RepID=UPI002FD917D8
MIVSTRSAPARSRRVTVVGIGADGVSGLSARALEALRSAPAIHGSPRQLALLEGDREVASVPRIELPRPLIPALVRAIESAAGSGEVFLASGDPMFHGIGATIARMITNSDIDAELVSIPAPSAASLAASRLGWPLAEVPTINLLTKPVEILLPHLHPGARIFVYCEDASGPGAIARLLDTHGAGKATVHILSDLTPDGGVVRSAPAADLARNTTGAWSDLVMLAIEMPTLPWPGLAGGQSSRAPGLADEVFEHDGQITKRIPRSVVMGLLRPFPGALLWDVGGGSGSISIEWMRAAPGARSVCFEIDPERRARIERNAAALGVGGRSLEVRDWMPPSLIDS